ncbi:MAG: replicative DNA helicase [Bacteroidota bacterium]
MKAQAHKTRSLHPSQQANEDLGHFVYGKLPPQAPKLEEAILGAIMLDKDAMPVVVDVLPKEAFYKPAHNKIYAAMRLLFAEGKPIDMLTVSEALKKAGDLEMVGGPFYLAELTGRVASAANIEYHSRLVSQKYMQRELIRAATRIVKDAYEDTKDVFELIAEAENAVLNISEGHTSGVENSSSLAAKFIKNLEEIRDKEDGLTGVPTGFTDIDRLFSGLQNTDFGIIAARPGMGKSALILAMAKNTADLGNAVAIFSLEMSDLQLMQRLVSLDAEIDSTSLRTGKMQDHEWQQLETSVSRISDLPIFIDDTPAISVSNIRAKCLRLKMQNDLKLVIVDYLQLMTDSSDKQKNREQEVSQISRSLKALAKELDVPVIALSRLSRAVETRGGTKRPMLSDLRESGSLEQDADWVSFIYRPEYYNIMEDEEGQSLKGVAEFIVAKNRHGATKMIKLKFISQFAKFDDYSDFNLMEWESIENSQIQEVEEYPF